MTYTERTVRETLAEARGLSRGEEPCSFLSDMCDETLKDVDKLTEYWYNKGRADACEKILSAIAQDAKRDRRIQTDAMAILEELEVISG